LEKVLIVRLDALGDAVLWVDAAKEFPKLFSKDRYQLCLLCNEVWGPLARTLPFFDEVHCLNRAAFFTIPLALKDYSALIRSFGYRAKLLREIRKCDFSIAVNTTFSRELLYGDSVVRASRAGMRVGSQGDLSNMTLWQKKIGDSWYTKLIPAVAQPLMELNRNAEFMRGLGIRDFTPAVPQLTRAVISVDIPAVNYFVVFPGAQFPRKRWPVASFAEVVRRLHAQTGWHVAVCGGPGEAAIASVLMQSFSNLPAHDYTGRTTIAELCEIIRMARLLVTNDTSAVHIAAAVSTPSVCILGGGHYGRFLPYDVEGCADAVLPQTVIARMACFGCNWKCIYPLGDDEPAPCVRSVSVDTVWAAIQRLLCKGEAGLETGAL
jgi:ADP-heptose:LPS heptosyltransferase